MEMEVYFFSNYPKIHIVGRLYLVRVYRYEAKKVAPWIFIVFPKETEAADNRNRRRERRNKNRKKNNADI